MRAAWKRGILWNLGCEAKKIEKVCPINMAVGKDVAGEKSGWSIRERIFELQKVSRNVG